MTAGRIALVASGALGTLAAALGGLSFWRKILDARAQRISDLLSARLPAHLAKWAHPIAYGAVRTFPGNFPTADGDTQFAWATFGAAVMDRESRGGETLSPRGEWNGEGDGGHAVTPWQLDKRYHAKYLARSDRSPELDSEYAFGLLAARWKGAAARSSGDLAVAATAAAYNADQHKVFAALDSGGGFLDVDALTTGRNYGSDVLRRYVGLSA